MSQLQHIRGIFTDYRDRLLFLDARLGQRRSYGMALEESMRLASALQARGAKRGGTVLLCASNSLELAILYLATWHTGAELVPVNPQLHPEDVAVIVAEAQPQLLIVTADLWDRLAPAVRLLSSERVLCFSETGSVLSASARERVNFRVAAEIANSAPIKGLPFGNESEDRSAFLRVYTSGTTSRPKGIQITWGGLISNERAFCKRHGVGPEHRFYNILPMAYLGGVHNLMLLPISTGASVVIDRPLSGGNLFGFWETVRTLEINTLWFTSAHLTMLMTLRDDDDLSFLHHQIRLGLVGMAPLSITVKRAFEERFGFMLYENYALSETAFLTTNDQNLPYKPGSSGLPLPGVELAICDDTMQPLPAGHDGQIFVRTPYMMKGYVNVSPNDLDNFRNGGFLTGDLGHFDEAGELFVTGRVKDLIIRGGLNISPATIEAALYRNGAVSEAAVVGMPHPVYGEQVIGVVTLKDAAKADTTSNDILSDCAQYLAGFQRPSRIYILNEMPKGSSNKIEKKTIRQLINEIERERI